MKHLFLIVFFIPVFGFSQTRLDDLSRKNGLAYAKGATTPFSGKAVAHFPNGDVQTSVDYKEGLPDGEIKSWYKKDALQVEGYMQKGKRSGTWKLYHENGKLKKQTAYNDDIQEGPETFWLDNGTLQKNGTYVNGKLEGKYEWFYDNGKKKQEGHFLKGEEDGAWQDWYEDGTQKMKGQFLNGEKNGTWTWWDKTGKVTTIKIYQEGLLLVDKDNLESYLEKMEYYMRKKDFRQAVKYVELAKATQTDQTENNPAAMNLLLIHSKCYSGVYHLKQGERVLLKGIGLSDQQANVIQEAHLAKSPDMLKGLITELQQKQKADSAIGNHIALSLCYNLLGDSVNLQQQQQLAMKKNGVQDWIYRISLELYRLATDRFESYAALQGVNKAISQEGATEKHELSKAFYLLKNEQFEEARLIGEKYLKQNDKNLSAILILADIEMAMGNIEQMKMYENKALAIAPEVKTGSKE